MALTYISKSIKPRSCDFIPFARSVTKICCLHLVTVLEEEERGKKLLQQKFKPEMEVTAIVLDNVKTLSTVKSLSWVSFQPTDF